MLSGIPRGRVRTFLARDIVDVLARVEADLTRGPKLPLLAIGWSPEADISRAIDRVLRALSGVVWAHWPDWYGAEAPFSQADVGAVADIDRATVERLGAQCPELNRTWVLQAVSRCRSGKRPLLEAFPPAVQMRQLMLALGQPELVLLLALEETDMPPAELLGFARAATWTAGETNLRVAAFVPAVYRGAAELDVITYGAVELDAEPRGAVRISPTTSAASKAPERFATAPVSPVSPLPGQGASAQRAAPGGPETAPGTSPGAFQRPAPRRGKDEPLRLISPTILGRPHPSSPGEQLLAEWLARDSELGPLFVFNQRLETSSGEAFVIDLLWREGKLAVEVDGYGWHSSPYAFAADRHRDYRLLCDGYRTLRLPHDEVLDDPALQCEKIRDVVHAIRKER